MTLSLSVARRSDSSRLLSAGAVAAVACDDVAVFVVGHEVKLGGLVRRVRRNLSFDREEEEVSVDHVRALPCGQIGDLDGSGPGDQAGADPPVVAADTVGVDV